MWIEELPSGKYKYFERYKDPYTEKYRRVSVTLSSKSNQAKKQATMALQDKIKEVSNKSNLESITFQKAISEFIPYYKSRVKESSFISFKSTEKAVLSSIGCETLIKNIDKKFFKQRLENMYYDQNYSLNYVKKVKAYVIMILEYAKENGYDVAPPYFKLNFITKQNESFEKYLEKNELRLLIDQLNSYSKNIRKADMVEFMALTGLRYGELIALRECDLYEGYLKITGTIDFRSGHYSEIVRTTPKTKASNRNVPLSERAIEILFKVLQENQFFKTTNDYTDSGYIFTNNKGNPIDYRTFAPTLKSAAKKAGIEKPVTSHYLRHTHISFLAELNVPIKAVMERVGHTDASTTLQVYTHVTNKMKSSLLNKLNTIDY
ncbi:tyrosine-type recombinase/integrase [Enterococcus faecalis]|uniref:tyrosine-type recombinase/integrase n=1 Tax=Enterococcus faecalis TaxID=1351 RepID=UPI003D0D2E0C